MFLVMYFGEHTDGGLDTEGEDADVDGTMSSESSSPEDTALDCRAICILKGLCDER